MSLLTTAEIKTHIETDLPEAALQRLIDDAEALIVEKYGANHSTTPLTLQMDGGERKLFLSRRAASISAVREYDADDETTTLETNDYRFRKGQYLERLSTGTNPMDYWGTIVEVDIIPVNDTARRKRVLIDLVQLAIRYNAVHSEKVGDYSVTNVDYQVEREKLLKSLSYWKGSIA